MTRTTLSSRRFNLDAGRAKRAAQFGPAIVAVGPAIVTDRGRPARVLPTYE
jgi:hypothetical protein